MFIQLGEEYLNLNQIARVEFKTDAGKYTALIYFAKPGGSDRHIVYDGLATELRQYLDQQKINLHAIQNRVEDQIPKKAAKKKPAKKKS